MKKILGLSDMRRIKTMEVTFVSSIQNKPLLFANTWEMRESIKSMNKTFSYLGKKLNSSFKLNPILLDKTLAFLLHMSLFFYVSQSLRLPDFQTSLIFALHYPYSLNHFKSTSIDSQWSCLIFTYWYQQAILHLQGEWTVSFIHSIVHNSDYFDSLSITLLFYLSLTKFFSNDLIILKHKTQKRKSIFLFRIFPQDLQFLIIFSNCWLIN